MSWDNWSVYYVHTAGTENITSNIYTQTYMHTHTHTLTHTYAKNSGLERVRSPTQEIGDLVLI